jgi:hypothetical protein
VFKVYRSDQPKKEGILIEAITEQD